MADPLNILKTILTSNWQAANTDNYTPSFSKITDVKRIDFDTKYDWILIHRAKPQQEPQGIGTGAKQVTESIDIDIRTHGEGRESHWLKVIAEVNRILDSHIINPGTGYDILDPDGDRQDLSDKTFQVWRYMINIKLINYNKPRGAYP